MNTKRNNEIKVVIAMMTATAAVMSGVLTAQSANAAPPRKTGSKRVVTVKMSGSRRAAINRAKALQAAATAAQVAAAETPPAQVQEYGTAEVVPGTVAVSASSPLNGTPVNNPQGTPLQPNPQFNNPIGVSNVPGVVNLYSPYGYAAYGPPLINTGNGFAPVYGTGYSMNGYTIAPYNGTVSPYAGISPYGLHFGF